MSSRRPAYSCKFPSCTNAYFSPLGNPGYKPKKFRRFPRNPALLLRWKSICNIPIEKDCRNCYVCDDHFVASDFNNPKSQVRLSPAAVPKPFDVCKRNFSCSNVCPDNQIQNNICSVGPISSKDKVLSSDLECDNWPHDSVVSEPQAAQRGPGEDSESEEEVQRNPEGKSEEEHLYGEEIEIIVCEDELKTCRLCLSSKTEVKDIFRDEIEDDIPIFVAIIACIHPIEISKDDRLPKEICLNCLENLAASFKFRASCLRNDKTLKKLYGQGNFQHKRKLERESFRNCKRRHLDEEPLRRTECKPHGLLRNIQAENILIYVESDSDKDHKRLDKIDNPTFKSRVGSSRGTVVDYAFNVKFCIVDGYLFEYRLCKRNLRYLKCASESCPSVGRQEKIDGVYTDIVNVSKAHNHKTPSKEEIQKQKFFHVMKMKVYRDRTLNMRDVYEEVCKYDPEVRGLVNIKNVVSDICRQLSHTASNINSFQEFYDIIESDKFWNIQFTPDGKQFYQEKFNSDSGKAIVFSNREFIGLISNTQLMFVDASFQVETKDSFPYHLVTALVWVDAISNYYPVLFSLVNVKSKELYQKVFKYLHDDLAPHLRPEEIVTEYEANLYYALAETYPDSSLGGSVFYYTQNLYKKVCSLHLSSTLEANTSFRNIYDMLLMLPLLPANTIADGLDNIETHARNLDVHDLVLGLFRHVREEWLLKVTPGLFCVHRMERRIDEMVMAPFKKLRDFMMFSKGKGSKDTSNNILLVVERLMELEGFLLQASSMKQVTPKDFNSAQKKCVLRAWQHIESHPKINLNHFFTRLVTYIKCIETQLWIWGFYRYRGDADDQLIAASDLFSQKQVAHDGDANGTVVLVSNDGSDAGEKVNTTAVVMGGNESDDRNSSIIMAVIDENGRFMLQGY